MTQSCKEKNTTEKNRFANAALYSTKFHYIYAFTVNNRTAVGIWNNIREARLWWWLMIVRREETIQTRHGCKSALTPESMTSEIKMKPPKTKRVSTQREWKAVEGESVWLTHDIKFHVTLVPRWARASTGDEHQPPDEMLHTWCNIICV